MYMYIYVYIHIYHTYTHSDMHVAHSPPLLPVCRERGENGGREKVGRGILSLSMQEKHNKHEVIEEGDLELVHHTH